MSEKKERPKRPPGTIIARIRPPTPVHVCKTDGNGCLTPEDCEKYGCQKYKRRIG